MNRNVLYAIMLVVFFMMYLNDFVTGNTIVLMSLAAAGVLGFGAFHLISFLKKKYDIQYILTTRHLIVVLVSFYFLQPALKNNVWAYHIVLGIIIPFVMVFSRKQPVNPGNTTNKNTSGKK